jgi:GGDEF domain-containing protein
VSTSIGVAFAEAFPVEACELGATADKALYAAKSRGRRQFALARLGDAGPAASAGGG